jgi:hypothetical protein
MSTVAVAALVAALAASAEQPRTPVALEYHAPSGIRGCPGGEEIQRAVSRRLGYDPFDPGAARRIQLRISESSSGLRADLQQTDETGRPAGKRTLESASFDCAELAAAVELAIAVAVDPQSLLVAPAPPPPQDPAPPEPEPPPADTPAPDAAAPAEPPPAAERAMQPHQPLRLELGGGVSGHAGLSPAIVPAGRLVLQLGYGMFSARLEGQLAFPARVVSGPGQIEVTSQLLVGGACAHADRVAFCAIMSAGALRGESTGFEESRRDSTFLLLAGGRVSAELVRGAAWSISPHLDVQAPITRTTVLLDEVPTWTTPPVAFAVGATVEYTLFR